MAVIDMGRCHFRLCWTFLPCRRRRFEQVQEENSPRLVEVQFTDGAGVSHINVIPGVWSEWVNSDFHVAGNHDTLSQFRFKVSGGEVRPRKMAIRVWKRTG